MVWEFNCAQHIRADDGMNLHLLVFCFRQHCRLVQNVFGNRYLTDVVQQCSGPDRQQLIFVLHAKMRGQLRSVGLDAADVTVRVPIFCVHGARKRLDRLKVQLIQLLNMLFGLLVFLNVEVIELIQNHSYGSAQQKDQEPGTFVKYRNQSGCSRRSHEIQKVQSYALFPERPEAALHPERKGQRQSGGVNQEPSHGDAQQAENKTYRVRQVQLQNQPV